MSRTIILLMDSFGIGYAHDAKTYGDEGADTLGHICQWFKENSERPLYLPNLAKLGLQAAAELSRGEKLPADLGAAYERGAYTYAEEVSKGKDTLSGHWEIAGVPVDFDWGYFPEVPNCFPQLLVDALVKEGNLPGVLGERHGSGTQSLPVSLLSWGHEPGGQPKAAGKDPHYLCSGLRFGKPLDRGRGAKAAKCP